ncbi:MAG TPA: zf-HC2 domain-containing protein [Gemmatimonadaceae bacterium]
MIDCPNGEVRDLLPDYLHDRLDSSARISVERHLAECAACRDELALLRDLRGTLQRTPHIDVASVAAAIPAYQPPVRKSWANGWRAAAAIAAIAIGGTSIALMGRAGKPTQVAQGPIATPAAPAPDVGVRGTAAAAPHTVTEPVTQPAPMVARAEPSVKPAPAPRGEELAIAGGTIADLSDGELSDLIGDLDSLDAVPSTDVESAESLLTGRHRGRHE